MDGAAMFAADPKKPIGGNIIAHASTTRYSDGIDDFILKCRVNYEADMKIQHFPVKAIM